MIQVLEKGKAIETLNRYFTTISATGYVKPIVVKRFLAYLFLVDFVEKIYEFLDESDYNFIRDALLKLFSTGCCLLPYELFCKNRTFIAESEHSNVFVVRIAEKDSWHRITEGDSYRTTE